MGVKLLLTCNKGSPHVTVCVWSSCKHADVQLLLTDGGLFLTST